jgi:lactate dehydrogenase-like 2-hydroxyacid dehydrogenase
VEEPVIVVTRRWPDPVEQELARRFPHVRLNPDDVPLGRDGLRAALEQADVVLPTVSDRLPADLFEGELRTRFLGNFGVGYNHIDVEAAAKAGIVVTNTPGVLTDTTADTAMMDQQTSRLRTGTGTDEPEQRMTRREQRRADRAAAKAAASEEESTTQS